MHDFLRLETNSMQAFPQTLPLACSGMGLASETSGKVVYNGWLYKKGGSGMTPRNWRRRWFIVRDDCIAYYYPSSEVSVPITNNDNKYTLIKHIELYCIVMSSVSALFNALYMYRTTVHCSVHIVLCCTVLYSVVQCCM